MSDSIRIFIELISRVSETFHIELYCHSGYILRQRQAQPIFHFSQKPMCVVCVCAQVHLAFRKQMATTKLSRTT